MPNYRVSWTGSGQFTLEADDKDEAKALSYDALCDFDLTLVEEYEIDADIRDVREI